MGRSKKLEKISNANNIKTTCKYVYSLISYRWIEIWNHFWEVFTKNASKWTLKSSIFSFFLYFRVFTSWFEAFTIQKRQIKLEIRNPRPDISLETKFRPFILKTVDRIFFSRMALIFSIFHYLSTDLRHRPWKPNFGQLS